MALSGSPTSWRKKILTAIPDSLTDARRDISRLGRFSMKIVRPALRKVLDKFQSSSWHENHHGECRTFCRRISRDYHWRTVKGKKFWEVSPSQCDVISLGGVKQNCSSQEDSRTGGDRSIRAPNDILGNSKRCIAGTVGLFVSTVDNRQLHSGPCIAHARALYGPSTRTGRVTRLSHLAEGPPYRVPPFAGDGDREISLVEGEKSTFRFLFWRNMTARQ